jgi:hypothetical protein
MSRLSNTVMQLSGESCGRLFFLGNQMIVSAKIKSMLPGGVAFWP